MYKRQVRAWGQGLKILILQFIKGNWKYGELKALEKFAPNLMIEQAGEGFVKQAEGEELSLIHIFVRWEAIVNS